MIKVLHVVYGGTGGAARIVLDIAMHHDKRFEPTVVLLGYQVNTNYLSELRESGIKGEAIIKSRKWDFNFLLRLRKTIRFYNPDILLLHTPVAYFWGRAAAIGLGIKAVLTVEHLAMKNYNGQIGRWINIVQSHIISDKTICVSDDVKAVVKEELFLPDDKIQIINNGIPVQKFSEATLRNFPQNKPAKIIMVSRLDQQKDPETLIRAIALLSQQGIDVKLDFVGDGTLRETLERLTKDLGLTHLVSFLGMRSDVPKLLFDSDIFVLSTHREGLPISLLEAMAIGLPCIATAVPGTLNVIEEGISGLLVKENDPVGLSQAISFLIKNPNTASDFGREAQKRVLDKFNIRRTAREYEKVFDRALALSNLDNR
ncbi:MAG: glycosyltransferase family 4 protein [Desulfitobacteriaceae bacterium]|nr:glycosyltransferase family 4 protein [Desulfitobacteriaceae bacterium]MDD4753917.1 glycosyltransferase family 4 protein [Desulfitobacteriaceae bacterium]